MKRYLFLLSCFLISAAMCAQKIIPLYEGEIPNSKAAPDEEKFEDTNGIARISKISRPTLSVYLPPQEKSTGAAVIICPGGGYWTNAVLKTYYWIDQD